MYKQVAGAVFISFTRGHIIMCMNVARVGHVQVKHGNTHDVGGAHVHLVLILLCLREAVH